MRSESWGQKGWAKATWATRPRPKNVDFRWVVRSTNWSGITMCRGAYSSLSEPTADTERIHSTPSIFRAKMLAWKVSSPGRIRCPRAWRGRKATRRPSSVPTMKLSEGWPKGVSTATSSTSVKPSIS